MDNGKSRKTEKNNIHHHAFMIAEEAQKRNALESLYKNNEHNLQIFCREPDYTWRTPTIPVGMMSEEHHTHEAS